MRKTQAVWAVVLLGFMICWSAAVQAQETTPAKSDAESKGVSQAKAKAEAAANYERANQAAAAAMHEQAEKPVHPYRLDFSLNEMEDGKKINSRQYSLNLNADDANEIKIGTRVPVEAKQGEFQYIDVGTTIWCRIGERNDGIDLTVRAENSNFAIPDQASGHEVRPIIRQLKISASTLVSLGKPMVVGSVDDPNSKRQFQLEVIVTKLR